MCSNSSEESYLCHKEQLVSKFQKIITETWNVFFFVLLCDLITFSSFEYASIFLEHGFIGQIV